MTEVGIPIQTGNASLRKLEILSLPVHSLSPTASQEAAMIGGVSNKAHKGQGCTAKSISLYLQTDRIL